MNNFYISASSLYDESIRIQKFIESKFYILIFNPFILDYDIDYKSYCLHYNSLKSYSRNLINDKDVDLIKQKFDELPDLNLKNFEFSTFGIPFYILCILFPLNVIS